MASVSGELGHKEGVVVRSACVWLLEGMGIEADRALHTHPHPGVPHCTLFSQLGHYRAFKTVRTGKPCGDPTLGSGSPHLSCFPSAMNFVQWWGMGLQSPLRVEIPLGLQECGSQAASTPKMGWEVLGVGVLALGADAARSGPPGSHGGDQTTTTMPAEGWSKNGPCWPLWAQLW